MDVRVVVVVVVYKYIHVRVATATADYALCGGRALISREIHSRRRRRVDDVLQTRSDAMIYRVMQKRRIGFRVDDTGTVVGLRVRRKHANVSYVMVASAVREHGVA